MSLPTDYCPQCCMVHVTCECPREDESEADYRRRMQRLEKTMQGEAPYLPDAATITESPDYLSGLIDQSGMSTRAVARQIGVDSGELRGYLSGRRHWPYPVQYTIEALARLKRR